MKTTKNYGLIKPEPAEYYDVEQFNQNMDVLDEKIKEIEKSNVPNVSTNNQTPTYTTASALTKLSSGEKLSVAFGKIAKAITEFIAHVGSKNNPHGVTALQLGAVTNSKVMNNLTTTESGYVLDARQGKTLYDKMANIKKATITIRGSAERLDLPGTVTTKIFLDSVVSEESGCLYDDTVYDFQRSKDNTGTYDGGIYCPYSGIVLVSGGAYIIEDSSVEVNKGCYIKRKTVNDSKEYGEEMEVCSQFIRDMGTTGGIHAGTMAVSVQDGDVFYLYARSSTDASCNTANAATYLSLTYLSVE